MTKKDFIVVAAALGKALSIQDLAVGEIEAAVNRFADAISHTNPAFKKAVFVKAALSATFSE